MNDICAYRICLAGQVDPAEINAMSPFEMTVELGDKASTLLTVHTDQSGLIGLMRHLHGRGLIFLSVERESYPVHNQELKCHPT